LISSVGLAAELMGDASILGYAWYIGPLIATLLFISSSKELPEGQRIPQEWAPLDDDLQEPPHLNIVDRAKVAKMISYFRRGVH
jgi:hypothetical protein